jgi:hypothetical protein
MARTTGKPDPIDQMVPRVKERVPIKIPTIDQLMWPAQPSLVGTSSARHHRKTPAHTLRFR